MPKQPSLSSRVNFNLLRYGNCWEDADILLKGLNLNEGKKIFIIASGGDNAFALLSTKPASIVAVDLSPVQLHVCELKKAAFQQLEYKEMLCLVGVQDCAGEKRWELFNKISNVMPTAATAFWHQNKAAIYQGIIHTGKFESYFEKFRRYFLPLAHSKQNVRRLLAEKDNNSQQEFYEKTWNNLRWQWLLRIFFSKMVMGKYGRDPEFLKHTSTHVGKYIQAKAAAHLKSGACTNNYFLHYIMTGNYGHHLPFYLRPENFETIKANLHKLHFVEADANELIQQQAFDAYCFSNIFEYMSKQEFEAAIIIWQKFMKKGARLAYWNLMAYRNIAHIAPELFIADEQLNQVLTAEDKGFFYSSFAIDEKV